MLGLDDEMYHEGRHKKYLVSESLTFYNVNYDHNGFMTIDTKVKSTIKLPQIHFYKSNFANALCSNFTDENFEGNDKFNVIFRKYICKISKLQNEMDVELIIESHSNGFLKVEIRVLQNEVRSKFSNLEL